MDISVHDLPKWPINYLNWIKKVSTQQVLRAYCRNMYTVSKDIKSTNTLFREELNTEKSKTSKPDTIVKQLPKRPPKNFVALSTKVFLVERMSVCE